MGHYPRIFPVKVLFRFGFRRSRGKHRHAVLKLLLLSIRGNQGGREIPHKTFHVYQFRMELYVNVGVCLHRVDQFPQLQWYVFPFPCPEKPFCLSPQSLGTFYKAHLVSLFRKTFSGRHS